MTVTKRAIEMTVTKRADELKPGDLRDCGRQGLQRVKTIERCRNGGILVFYVGGWGHGPFFPEDEVRVAV